jgi:hypothetical protein
MSDLETGDLPEPSTSLGALNMQIPLTHTAGQIFQGYTLGISSIGVLAIWPRDQCGKKVVSPDVRDLGQALSVKSVTGLGGDLALFQVGK